MKFFNFFLKVIQLIVPFPMFKIIALGMVNLINFLCEFFPERA